MSSGAEGTLMPLNEREFILRALCDNIRADGRFFLEMRKLQVNFERSHGRASTEVILGKTRVFTVVTASVEEPFPDRPTEGFIGFNVDLSPMASPAYEMGGRPTSYSVEIARMLERQIREARAIDMEALCIVPGVSAWGLRVDLHVLDDGGNLIDACCFSAVAALLHFRRADVSVHEGRAIVHSYSERPPVPLSVHHIPVAVTLGLVSNPAKALAELLAATGASAGVPGAGPAAVGGAASSSSSLSGGEAVTDASGVAVLLDPTSREEAVCDGSVSFVLNAHKELCGVHKLGGAAISPATLVRIARVAAEKAGALVALLREALAAAEKAAAERDKIAHAAAAGFPVAGTIDTADVAAAAAATGAASAAASSVRRTGAGLALQPEEDEEDDGDEDDDEDASTEVDDEDDEDEDDDEEEDEESEGSEEGEGEEAGSKPSGAPPSVATLLGEAGPGSRRR